MHRQCGHSRLPTITLPVWDAITWLTVLGMAAVVLGLLLAGLFATLSYSTPSVELPLVLVIVGIFVAILRSASSSWRYATSRRPNR